MAALHGLQKDCLDCCDTVLGDRYVSFDIRELTGYTLKRLLDFRLLKL
jgi:hypothetical protein